MSQAVMVDRDMVVTLGPQVQVAPVGRDAEARSLEAVEPSGQAAAPFTGPAVFRLPLVLPKAGRLRCCEIAWNASHAGRIDFAGAAGQSVPAGEQGVTLNIGDATPTGRDFVIEELPFADFAQFDLAVTVDAPPDQTARLAIKAVIDYRLPEESAADYLNYIMTQA
jgi:hypothetical protein